MAACEKGGLRCSVTSFFEGLKYFEIAQLEIRDVRLVYAPAEGIGVFGGETDNWRWPRHTGDWSFLRAYVGKDGKPAAFSKDNVPYKPKHWLKVSAEGTKPGDLVFVVGYPGRTLRHRTFAEIKETTEWALPRSMRLAEEQLALIDKLTAGNQDLAIKLSGRIQGLNNGLTNTKGVLEGLVKGGALALKEAQEKALTAWIAATPARQKQYGDVLPGAAALQAEGEKVRERNAALSTLSSASSYLSAAQTLYRLSLQRPEDRPRPRRRVPGARLEPHPREPRPPAADARRRRPTARSCAGPWAWPPRCRRASGSSRSTRPSVCGRACPRPTPTAPSTPGSTSCTPARRSATAMSASALIDKSTAELMATGDSFIALAAALEPLAESIREAAKNRAGAYARLRPRYMEALLAKAGGLVAPDANSTLRVTYGQVKGVDAKDGLFYKPQTGLAGILEKQTGEGDFNAPKKQIDAIAAFLQDEEEPVSRRGAQGRAGELPVDGGHDRRQLRVADAEREGRTGRPAVRRHLRVGVVRLPVRRREDAVDPRRQPLHAVEHGRGGRRDEPDQGNGHRPDGGQKVGRGLSPAELVARENIS